MDCFTIDVHASDCNKSKFTEALTKRWVPKHGFEVGSTTQHHSGKNSNVVLAWECFEYGWIKLDQVGSGVTRYDKIWRTEKHVHVQAVQVVPGRTFAQSLSCPRIASRLDWDSQICWSRRPNLLLFVYCLFTVCLLLIALPKEAHGHLLLYVPGCVGFFIVATQYVSSPATFACLSNTKFR